MKKSICSMTEGACCFCIISPSHCAYKEEGLTHLSTCSEGRVYHECHFGGFLVLIAKKRNETCKH